MRSIAFALIAAALVFLAGCGSLDPLVVVHPGGSQPDPKQAAWHRCLFGTRWVAVNPPQNYDSPENKSKTMP